MCIRDSRKGVSLVLANTPKALRILKALEKEASFVGVDIEKAIIGNRALVKKTPYAKERDDLFHCLRNEGYEKAAKKYFRPETRLSFRLRNLVPQRDVYKRQRLTLSAMVYRATGCFRNTFPT